MKAIDFIAHGVCVFEPYITVQLSRDCTEARYSCNGKAGYWQKVKYTRRGRSYISRGQNRIYFDEVCRISE